MRRTAIAAVAVLIGSCTAPSLATSPTTASPIPASTTARTTADTATTTAPTTIDGWKVLDVPAAPVTVATMIDGSIIVGSCSRSGGGGLFTNVLGQWAQAATGCITQIELTSMGSIAIGPGASVGIDRSGSSQRNVLISDDGRSWDAIDDWGLSIERAERLGTPEAVFVLSDIDTVSVLFTRVAEGEARIAGLVTTAESGSWDAVDSAVFDNADIATVIPGGDGLIAVGASPGGEGDQTAAVFTSADTVTWRRVTPTTSDFGNKVMTDVIATPDGFVAVGGDFFETGLMTAWTSPDGSSWTRSPHPEETLDPDVAHMTAHRLTSVDGVLWASGEDYDASRPLKSLPALWRSDDGGRTWHRVPDEAFVPFVLFDDGRVRIATGAAGDVLLIQE